MHTYRIGICLPNCPRPFSKSGSERLKVTFRVAMFTSRDCTPRLFAASISPSGADGKRHFATVETRDETAQTSRFTFIRLNPPILRGDFATHEKERPTALRIEMVSQLRNGRLGSSTTPCFSMVDRERVVLHGRPRVGRRCSSTRRR